ncbi:MAG: hypothetical protein KC910_12315 [Candidatus Eremiobacteraeota bacterium]|nr:hypothetical protein [Candidatus Eremiobacteraeota bacterium]
MVICLGQQPCGFFPKRFLVAKLVTARRLQQELGGRLVLFWHDSDHDHRETRTSLRDGQGRLVHLNFAVADKLERKYAPLYLKTIAPGWQDKTARRLPRLAPHLVELFASIQATRVADFCLAMYRGMGLLEGVEVVRSSDPGVRRAATPVLEHYADLPYQGRVVRARAYPGGYRLHQGGEAYLEVPAGPVGPEQVSPTRDSRLVWMQSVIGCTHYVAGASEMVYLDRSATPEITFVERDFVPDAGLGWTG